MTIAAVMQGPQTTIHTCNAGDSVGDVAAKLAEHRIGAAPVVDGSDIVGIFSERDIIYGLATYGTALLDKPVGEVMTAPAISVTADTPILSALSLMTRRRIRHLPVVDGPKLVGFVSIGDLVKHRIERIESEAAAMRDYIQGA